MKIFTRSRSLLFLLTILFANLGVIKAQVVVTQPIGTQNISNDKSQGGPAAGPTSATDLIIEDSSPGDFPTGTGTITFLAPSTGWTLTGNIAFGGSNITAASVAFAASKITITYTVNNSPQVADNFLRLQGITVQSTSKAVGTPFLVSKNGGTLAPNGLSDGTFIATLSKVVGSFSNLQVLLPGQVNAPTNVAGKTGTPTAQTAGMPFNVIVNAVDWGHNIVSAAPSDNIALSSPNPGFVAPPAQALSSGITTFNVVLNTAQTITTITAANTTNGAMPANTSSNVKVNGSATDYFRSANSGVWATAATWETSADGSTNWVPAGAAPSASANTITIRSTHVVQVAAGVSVDQVVVESGSELLVRAGTFTIVDGPGVDMQVNGILTGSVSGVINTTAGTTVIANGARYQHKYTTTNGTIPIATWNDGSTIEISGYTAFTGVINNSDQNFSNFVWNAPNQTASSKPILGAFNAKNFTVESTGAGTLNLGSSGTTSNISNNFTLNNGTVAVSSSGAKTINIGGHFVLIDGLLTTGLGTTANINFSGTTSQDYINNQTTLSGAINFAINTDAIVDFRDYELKGTTGTFVLNAGGTIITRNTNGLAAAGINTGTIQNTGARTFADGANFVYNGTLPQIAGTGLPVNINSLTVDNLAGVTLFAGTEKYTITQSLVVDGLLDVGNHPLDGSYTTSGTGRLKTSATNAFSAGRVWNIGVEFNSNDLQNIVAGTYKRTLMMSNAGVKVAPTTGLNVEGNWLSSGGNINFYFNPGSVVNFNGANAQTIEDLGSHGGAGVEFVLVNFSGAGVKTLTTGKFKVGFEGVLTIGANTVLNVNDNLTLASGLANTATIAAIPATGGIVGNVTVQRSLRGGGQLPFRTFRMLSSPVYNNANPSARTYTLEQFKDDMIITGQGGAVNGFDPSPNNSATAYSYNGGFQPVTNINSPFPIGTGLNIFFRGDRTDSVSKVTPPFVNPENVVMDFTGELNQQDVMVALSNKGNLLGNPYASSIDWNSTGISKVGLVNNIIRIWNPGNRAYATYDGTTGANQGSNVIALGQAFLVEADTSGASSVAFSESAKINAQPPLVLLSAPISDRLTLNGETSATDNSQTLKIPRTELRLTLTPENAEFNEEAVVIFEADKKGEYKVSEDASYLWDAKEQQVFLSTRSIDNMDLVINYMPEVSLASSVKLNINNLNKAGSYKLLINYKDVPAGHLVKLNDAFLATNSVVQDGDLYPFMIDKNVPNSFGANRFSVSFELPATLPVTLSSFTAVKVNEGVNVKWSSATEINHSKFEVERAADDKVFKKLQTITAKGSGAVYSYLDRTPLLGNNYYRLVQVSNDNKTTVTAPVVINYTNNVQRELITVFPNPVQENFTVKYNGALKGTQQTLKIVNTTGQVMLTKAVTAGSLTSGVRLNVGNLAAGVYIIEIYETANKKVGQVKLIKK